jgi:hypothetical protein
MGRADEASAGFAALFARFPNVSKFGNMAESSIEEILGGEVARRYRRQVYGLEQAEPNLLCVKCCHIRIEP